MRYRVEAWPIVVGDEPWEEGRITSMDFDSSEEAVWWCWARMLQGFQTRLYHLW